MSVSSSISQTNISITFGVVVGGAISSLSSFELCLHIYTSFLGMIVACWPTPF